MNKKITDSDSIRTINEIHKVDYFVEKNLSTKEFTRNSDTYLAFEGMCDMGLAHKTPVGYLLPFENISKIPALETWKRRRAFFQNVKKQFLPTNEVVIRKRRTREKVFKNVNKTMHNIYEI